MIERIGGKSTQVRKVSEIRLGNRLENRFGIQCFFDPNK